MLSVYGQYKYFYPYSVEIDFRRQNLTSTDVRLWVYGYGSMASINICTQIYSINIFTLTMRG